MPIGVQSLIRFSLAIAAGFCIGLSLSFQATGLVPVILLAILLRAVSVGKVRLTATFAFAAGFALGVGSELWVAEALTNLGSTSFQAVAACAILAAWVSAIPWVAIGLSVHSCRRAPIWIAAGLVGSVAFLTDWLSFHLLLTIPWTAIGLTQPAGTGLSQLAVVGGVPLVSGFVVAVAYTLSQAGLHRCRPRDLAACISCCLALAAGGLPIAEYMRSISTRPFVQSDVSVLLVQPNISRRTRWVSALQSRHLADLERISAEAIDTHGRPVDLIVWPENALTSDVTKDPSLRVAFENSIQALDTPVLLGVVRDSQSEAPLLYRNSALWQSPRTGFVDAIDKTLAVPMIESEPEYGLLAKISQWLVQSDSKRRVETASTNRAMSGDFDLITVLCYEALFASVVQSRHSPEARAIINIADDSWVENEVATRQLASYASYRAIEQRLPLIRVAHGGLSIVTDEFGVVTESLPIDEEAWRVVNLGSTSPATNAEKLAILSLPIGSGFIVWWIYPLAERRLFNRGIS